MFSVLAFDLGATSSRGIVFSIINGNITQQEVYRFTGYKYFDSTKNAYFWNINDIISQIKSIILTASIKYDIQSIGIDSWGCDFVLLDSHNHKLMDPLCYETMLMNENYNICEELPEYFFEITGIPNSPINTSSQLIYLKRNYPEIISQAHSLLMIPDYILFLLTGCKYSESSIASTTQLFDLEKRTWSKNLVDYLEIPMKIFPKIILPFSRIGYFEINDSTSIPIHSIVSHDTACAVFTIPESSSPIYFISSGTWSIIGEKNEIGLLKSKGLSTSYSYEQAGDGKILKLKNILGMWYIEKVANEMQNTTNEHFNIPDIQELLMKKIPKNNVIDLDKIKLSSHNNISKSLIKIYGKYGHMESIDIFQIIYQNLAFKYADILSDLNHNKYPIFIFGGGSKSKFMNQLITNITQSKVIPIYDEASALGNSIAQFIALNLIKPKDEAYKLLKNIFDLKEYTPINNPIFNEYHLIYINNKRGNAK